MGEDSVYIKYIKKIQYVIKGYQKVGSETLDMGSELREFLNKWRSRVSEKVKNKINIWYDQNHNILDELPSSIVNVNLYDQPMADKIKYIYRSLLGAKANGIEDTIASKTLHMLKPDLFVLWDRPIKS